MWGCPGLWSSLDGGSGGGGPPSGLLECLVRVDRAAHRHRDEARERDRDREQGESHQSRSMTSLPWLGRDVPDVVSAPCRSAAPGDVIAITKCTYSRRLSPPLSPGTLTYCFLMRILRTRVLRPSEIGENSGENWENCCRSVAALPGYISNHVPHSRASISADFGGCPGAALRSLGGRHGLQGTFGRNEPAPPRVD